LGQGQRLAKGGDGDLLVSFGLGAPYPGGNQRRLRIDELRGERLTLTRKN